MHIIKRYFLFYLNLFYIYTAYAVQTNLEIIEPTNDQQIDYTFFNNPITNETRELVDSQESQDIDFSFFNNPYAFENFKKLAIKAKISGYTEYIAWWSNRQGVGDGDVFEIIFPERPEYDADCRDINARGQHSMTVLDTRFRGEFFGPHIFGASTFAFIESDVFGFDFTNLRFRIWHAFLQFSWQNSKLLLGQFWHPFSVVNTFPPTITIDNGSPVTPNCRNPQIRYTIIHGNKKLLIAALAQHQFASDGPDGHSSIYLRNARVPILVARAVYDNKNHIYAGIGALFQRLKPRIKSDTDYQVNESINSVQASLFATIKFEPLEIRQQLTFAQNGNNLNLLGGFAVTDVEPVTDLRHYTNINAISYWIDININRLIEPGIFMGVVKNMGARTNIIPCLKNPDTDIEISTIYSLGKDISTVFKCYPRIRFHILPVDFAFEFEYTRTTYGCIDEMGKVKNIEPVNHIRGLFASYYYF